MRTFSFWLYVIATGVLLYAFLASAWNYVRAWDLDFDAAAAQRQGRTVDMKAARSAAIILPQLAIPLGLVVIALMVYNLVRYEWWQVYTIIGIFWFISAPFRRYWVIYTAIRVDKRLRELGLRKDSEGQSHKVYKPLEATKLYYRNGIHSQRHRPGNPESMLFVGRLKRFNKISWLWRWVRYLRVCLPVLTEAAMSLGWPTMATVMTLAHSAQAAEPVSVHPWWERGN